MADNLSPLVNLDLVNQIYRTINAQISERVYDPKYYSAAKLGDANYRYVSAYLEALNVSGNAIITGNTSTGTLNNLTLTATSPGFTISNNAISRVLTVSSTAALGSNTASENGAITVKSAGTGPTTIIGPSGNTAQFNVKTIIGDTTYTGPVTIRSSSTGSTTIIGPNGGIAELKAGTCVITDDCSTANTEGKIVQRDSSKDIKVTSVNNVNISTDANKVALSKGTASVAVSANAAAVINSNLTVNSVATLGSTDSGKTGEVVIMSGGTGKATITGPSDGTAKLKNGTCLVEADATTVANDSKIVQRSKGNISVSTVNNAGIKGEDNTVTLSSGTTEATFKNDLTVNSIVVLGDSIATGSVTVKSAGVKSTTIIGPTDTPAELVGGKYTDSVTVYNDTTPTAGKLLKIKAVPANTFLAGPSLSTASDAAPDYRKINSNDLTDVVAGAAKKLEASVKINNTDFDGSGPITTDKWGTARKITIKDNSATNSKENANIDGGEDIILFLPSTIKASITGNADTASQVSTLATNKDATHYISFVDSNNPSIIAENVYTNANLTYNPSTKTLSTSNFSGTLNGTASTANKVAINRWPEPEIKSDGTKTEFVGYVTVTSEDGASKSVCISRDSGTERGVKVERTETTTAEGETIGTYHLYAGAVHNAVWNDLADCIEVPEDTDLEFGYCYSWNGNKVEKTSRKSKNCIGIHSNTAGLFMGEKPVRTIQAAVAGFALAYVDRIYPEGTPLTWSDDGKLTKCTVLKRVLHPERVIATFYKEEKQESWHGVKVNNRHWVKVR